MGFGAVTTTTSAATTTSTLNYHAMMKTGHVSDDSLDCSRTMVQVSGHPKISWKGVSLIFLMPALGGFLYGYDIGATSFVLNILQHNSNADGSGAGAEAHQHSSIIGNRMITTVTSSSHHHPRHVNHHVWNDPVDYSSSLSIDDNIVSSSSSVSSASSFWWNDFSQHQMGQGLLVGAVSAGALLGSHIVLFHAGASSRLGRRLELRIAAILYLLGCTLNVASGTFLKHAGLIGWGALILGRLLFGVGVGFVMHGAPTYMAEMAPSSIRGAIVAAKESVIVLGIVFGYTVGDLVSSMQVITAVTTPALANDSILTEKEQLEQQRWIYLYVISGLLAVPMCALTFIVPRSMRWLLMHGLRDEAKESMRFVYTSNDAARSHDHGATAEALIDHEFEKLVASINANQLQKKMSSTLASMANSDCCCDNSTMTGLCESRLFSSPSVRPALQAASGLIFFQQMSGQPSVISYATILFDAAGWSGHASVITALLMLCVSSTTVLLVDRLGRKRLLMICCGVMMLSLLTLSYSFWNWNNEASGRTPLGSTEKILVLIAMFSYIGGYQIGFGPITWLVVSEVFPQNVRGPATALGVELNYLLNFLVQFGLPIVQVQVGWGPTFLLFASVLVSALFFVRTYVPETSGMSLEEIEAHWLLRAAEDQLLDVDIETKAIDEPLASMKESMPLVYQRHQHYIRYG